MLTNASEITQLEHVLSLLHTDTLELFNFQFCSFIVCSRFALLCSLHMHSPELDIVDIVDKHFR